MPKHTGTSDEGGPARRLGLRLADDEIRCRRLITRDDGTKERCSRFGIRMPDGRRDEHCIAHSTTDHAAEIRRQAIAKRHAPEGVDPARRAELANEIASEPWQSSYDITLARVALVRGLIVGDLSTAEVREVRAILDAAEAQMRVPPCDWSAPG